MTLFCDRCNGTGYMAETDRFTGMVHTRRCVCAPDLDLVPGRARCYDPPTSKVAAEMVAFRSGSQKARLIDAFRRAPHGLTAWEAAQMAGLPELSQWHKRVSELHRHHALIEPTGETRRGVADAPCTVYRAVAS
jgi:hypothetical protein